MKIQNKLYLLIGSIFGILILSFLLYQNVKLREKKVIFQQNLKNQEIIINLVSRISRMRIEQMVKNNSGWDELVDFTKHPDPEWAKYNINFFVDSFNASFVLVYNQEKELVYQYGDTALLKNISFPDEKMISLLFANSPFCNYHKLIKNEAIEVYGATIVPASDMSARRTQANGYLLVGQKWNNKAIQEESKLMNFSVKLLSDSALSVSDVDSDSVYIKQALVSETGETIGQLVFSKANLAKKELATFVNISLFILIFVIGASIASLIYFRRVVIFPLNKLSKALENNDLKPFNSFDPSTIEFRQMKSLIVKSHEMEKALVLKNKDLMESNAVKDKLFSIIGHDLKNPIGNVLMVSELLADSVKNDDKEYSAELVEMIRVQTEETLALLVNLVDWAKSQASQVIFQPEPVDLKKLSENVHSNLITAAAIKDIKLETEVAEDTIVMADSNMLSTILRNLCTNAVKFTNQGGVIKIIGEKQGDEVLISVVDNGIGMNDETQARLFKIGTNISTNGTANEKGTGLGLILCKEFVERHGSRIKIESEPGKGSKFMFKLKIFDSI